MNPRKYATQQKVSFIVILEKPVIIVCIQLYRPIFVFILPSSDLKCDLRNLISHLQQKKLRDLGFFFSL